MKRRTRIATALVAGVTTVLTACTGGKAKDPGDVTPSAVKPASSSAARLGPTAAATPTPTSTTPTSANKQVVIGKANQDRATLNNGDTIAITLTLLDATTARITIQTDDPQLNGAEMDFPDDSTQPSVPFMSDGNGRLHYDYSQKNNCAGTAKAKIVVGSVVGANNFLGNTVANLSIDCGTTPADPLTLAFIDPPGPGISPSTTTATFQRSSSSLTI